MPSDSSSPFALYRFGPLIHHWTAHYESKHRYLKQLAARLGNFKNLAFTLATRHQMSSATLYFIPPCTVYSNGTFENIFQGRLVTYFGVLNIHNVFFHEVGVTMVQSII